MSLVMGFRLADRVLLAAFKANDELRRLGQAVLAHETAVAQPMSVMWSLLLT